MTFQIASISIFSAKIVTSLAALSIKSGEFDAFISEYIKTEAIDEFVIGYPVQMNNKSSESVKHIDPFIKKIVKSFPGIPVKKIDERFTSGMALQTMIDGGVKKKDRQDKAMIDKISAAIILKSYLDRRGKAGE